MFYCQVHCPHDFTPNIIYISMTRSLSSLEIQMKTERKSDGTKRGEKQPYIVWVITDNL